MSSAVRNRLKRLVNSGPLLGPVVISVSSGTMPPFAFFTNSPSCFASWRNSGSACKYLVHSAEAVEVVDAELPSSAPRVVLTSFKGTPDLRTLLRSMSAKICGTVAR